MKESKIDLKDLCDLISAVASTYAMYAKNPTLFKEIAQDLERGAKATVRVVSALHYDLSRLFRGKYNE